MRVLRKEITVYTKLDGMKTFHVYESDAKILARALELAFISKGDFSLVQDILELETGLPSIGIHGFIQIASAYYDDKDSVYFNSWSSTEV